MLWARYRSNRDEATRHALLDQYIGLVYHAAREIARSVPKHLEFEELVSAGTVGLIQALETFEPERGLAFSTFAMPRIRGAVLDELRSWDWVPRSVRDRARILSQKLVELRSSLGREPLPAELASSLGVEEDVVRGWLSEAEGPQLIPLEGGDDPESTGSHGLAETLSDPAAVEPIDVIENDHVLAELREALSDLPKKDQTVLALFYYEDLTQRQVAQVLHVSESRISQIRSRALQRLRDRLRMPKAA